MSDSLRPLQLQNASLPCPSLSLWVCSNSCPLRHWCHPTIWTSVASFSSCPQSFPTSVFSMSWLFSSSGQSIGASASASVLPMNIQGWFPFRIDWFHLRFFFSLQFYICLQGTHAPSSQHSNSEAPLILLLSPHHHTSVDHCKPWKAITRKWAEKKYEKRFIHSFNKWYWKPTMCKAI